MKRRQSKNAQPFGMLLVETNIFDNGRRRHVGILRCYNFRDITVSRLKAYGGMIRKKVYHREKFSWTR